MSKPPAPAEPAAARDREAIAAALIAWFTAEARDLPWRRDRTGYRVWVSEVMLQQTRVATVLPYYDRFLRAFPTVQALAASELGAVLALWSGLGYYRRARGLHEGAREVAARFGGELPRTVEELRAIRGIGPYTAGAIASLAFGVRAPIVDGNVVRVLARLFAVEGDARKAAVQKRIWALAAELVPPERPGVFNEAMMELGATLCTLKAPRCLLCPVTSLCQARAAGIEQRLPQLSAPTTPPTVHVAALLSRRDGEVLLGRRRGEALFGGLWEPPMIETETAADPEGAVRPFAEARGRAGTVVHVLSHRRMEVVVLDGGPAARPVYPPIYDEVRYVAEADLPSYGVSTLARKVLATSPSPPKRAAKKRPAKKRS